MESNLTNLPKIVKGWMGVKLSEMMVDIIKANLMHVGPIYHKLNN